MFSFNSLDIQGNIFYFKNCISEPDRYISFLEDNDNNTLSYQSIEKWKPWYASDDKNTLYGKQKRISNFLNTSDDFTNKRNLYLINSINDGFYMCTKYYCENHRITNFFIQKEFVINKYTSNIGMGAHIDAYSKEINNTYTILFYLNDDYKNGEIEFPDKKIIIKPEKGSILIFPANYTHIAHPVSSGVKYFALSQFFEQ